MVIVRVPITPTGRKPFHFRTVLFPVFFRFITGLFQICNRFKFLCRQGHSLVNTVAHFSKKTQQIKYQNQLTVLIEDSEYNIDDMIIKVNMGNRFCYML